MSARCWTQLISWWSPVGTDPPHPPTDPPTWVDHEIQIRTPSKWNSCRKKVTEAKTEWNLAHQTPNQLELNSNSNRIQLERLGELEKVLMAFKLMAWLATFKLESRPSFYSFAPMSVGPIEFPIDQQRRRSLRSFHRQKKETRPKFQSNLLIYLSTGPTGPLTSASGRHQTQMFDSSGYNSA